MTYTHTEHGLLPEPLKEKPEHLHYATLEIRKRDYEAYLKTAIPVIEGFKDKIPVGSSGLIDDIHFKVRRYNTDAPGEPDIVAIPLVDMKEVKEQADTCPNCGVGDFIENGGNQFGCWGCGYVVEPATASAAPPVVSHPSSSSNSIEQQIRTQVERLLMFYNSETGEIVEGFVVTDTLNELKRLIHL